MSNTPHPGGNPGANLKSISHRCHLFEVAFVWELTNETIHLPLGCLQGGTSPWSGITARGQHRGDNRHQRLASLRLKDLLARTCNESKEEEDRPVHRSEQACEIECQSPAAHRSPSPGDSHPEDLLFVACRPVFDLLHFGAEVEQIEDVNRIGYLIRGYSVQARSEIYF